MMKYTVLGLVVIFCIFTLLIADDQVPAKQNDRIVYASHYDWYDVWYLPIYTIPLKSLFGHLYPDGLYYSGDECVAAIQNNVKNEYGIDVDIISWWGEGTWQETMCLAGYFNAYNLHTRQFCILYEVTGLLVGENGCYDFNNPENERRFKEHMKYLEPVFNHPGYHKIDGRSVIYIWTGSFINFERVSNEIREKVYLIGSEGIFFPPYDDDKERIERLKCWDAITDYGICTMYVADKYGSLTIEAIEEYARAVVNWHAILQKYAPDTELMFPVQFWYHDNRGDTDPITGKNRILTNTYEQAEMFLQAIRFLSDKTGYKRFNITSWNEHYEYTSVEPTEEFGYSWLKLIKQYLASDNKSSKRFKLNYRIRNAIKDELRKNKIKWRRE